MAADLQQKLAVLPTQPGVYLMKNDDDDVIYVGKAVNLRSRVRSYFQRSRNQSAKVRALIDHIADVEYIVTDSEVEALILENTLIKEHTPWYNVRLKDDKTYPFVKVTLQEPFPRVLLVRRRLKDKARYFGPYTNVIGVRQTTKFLRKLFPVRTCSKTIVPGQQDRPCLNYHIGRCFAPCAGLVDQQTYRQMIDGVCLVLEGRHEQIIPGLERQMAAASEQLEFEKAARVRDQIRSLRDMVAKQKVVAEHGSDHDVLGWARAGETGCVQVFFVRAGKLMGRDHFLLDCPSEESGEDILQAFLQQFYSENTLVPKEIYLPKKLPEAALLEGWLTRVRGSRVYLRVPQRGEKRRLVEMVSQNAQLVLAETTSSEQRQAQERLEALDELRDALGLEHPIGRMEAFDISNIQGSHMTAAMVVVEDGLPVPDQYRRFKIKTVEDGPNDYAAMQEVIRRRFARGLAEQKGEAEGSKFSVFPDLVLIDGGRGQLNAALESRNALELQIPFIGLAKRFEEVFVEGHAQPLILPRDSQGLHMIQRIRDEAHRFAITYHRQLRSKAGRASVFDAIPGVGPKRKQALLRHFGSVKKIRAAGLEELQAVKGISPQLAADIIQYLKKDGS